MCVYTYTYMLHGHVNMLCDYMFAFTHTRARTHRGHTLLEKVLQQVKQKVHYVILHFVESVMILVSGFSLERGEIIINNSL